MAYAQAIMGHASGTIAFDTYGSTVPIVTIASLLREPFAVDGKTGSTREGLACRGRSTFDLELVDGAT